MKASGAIPPPTFPEGPSNGDIESAQNHCLSIVYRETANRNYLGAHFSDRFNQNETASRSV